MAKDPTLKKKRKSEAVAMEVDAPAEGTASAVAVVADVSLVHTMRVDHDLSLRGAQLTFTRISSSPKFA
jgi:hypothetical protein